MFKNLRCLWWLWWKLFLLCDRRRRVAIAFWMSLFWVAFLIWGLLRLQVESEKVANDRE
jgi:hypothetical protein